MFGLVIDVCPPYSIPPSDEVELSYRGLPYDLLEDLLPQSGAWKQAAPLLMPHEDVATGGPRLRWDAASDPGKYQTLQRREQASVQWLRKMKNSFLQMFFYWNVTRYQVGQWEPCKSRDLRTVLRGAWGETRHFFCIQVSGLSPQAVKGGNR
jgi:hypothetical protein